jgi:hypothetical protein
MSPSDSRAWRAFVNVADTLVADFDIIEFLGMLADYGVELLGVSACGILLADPQGGLNLVAASTERVRALELFQLQTDEGPCLDAYHSMTAVTCPNLAAAADRWPTFAPAAEAAGFTAGPSTCSPPCPGPWTPRPSSAARPWPTWPRSASCTSGPSAARRW